ncbi:MAG: hypothetical protein PHI27_03295 [Eubacteriales bacterium]|nr:hypothetical protein [Eubacteriales bacterium]MDD3881262.1 hypothetical protein [Eubacteriales bacterium]MDD4512180.1 hypothetical protein [Eubacteriales bacterium]
MNEVLIKSRDILENVTPLRVDCGRICGDACCKSGGDELGMYLFPHEEELIGGGFTIKDAGGAMKGEKICVCNGSCDRKTRPLSCRIFPLAFSLKSGKPEIETDVRAWPVCPLMNSGLDGMLPEFRKRVYEALLLLWNDEESKSFMIKLDRELESYRTLTL